jgi:hypothetical protein
VEPHSSSHGLSFRQSRASASTCLAQSTRTSITAIRSTTALVSRNADTSWCHRRTLGVKTKLLCFSQLHNPEIPYPRRRRGAGMPGRCNYRVCTGATSHCTGRPSTGCVKRMTPLSTSSAHGAAPAPLRDQAHLLNQICILRRRLMAVGFYSGMTTVRLTTIMRLRSGAATREGGRQLSRIR